MSTVLSSDCLFTLFPLSSEHKALVMDFFIVGNDEHDSVSGSAYYGVERFCNKGNDIFQVWVSMLKVRHARRADPYPHRWQAAGLHLPVIVHLLLR